MSAALQVLPLQLPYTVVSASGITKRFGRVHALRGIDLALKAGRITAILGPNGAGKSTLIKLLLGLTRPDGGALTVQGAVIGDDPEYRAHVGYMPQHARFPENLTGREVVTLLSDLRGGTGPVDDELFDAFGLAAQLDRPVRTLSGGNRQKLSAAVAFMFRPALLILDEPTAGLDPVASAVLKTKIAQARNAGVSVLLVSHVLSELEALVDDVVLLLDGAVAFEGSLRRLREVTGESRLECAIARLMQWSAP
ncbi:MAG: ABC transporter ATP-binding protein [Gemmatimonadales bacterium]